MQQNNLSMEQDRILYDLRVTKAAFNIDWMATGEVFNDEQHLPELRLKFWKFEEEKQKQVDFFSICNASFLKCFLFLVMC